MPGYLIKTPFFTASIANDEELTQLASVDTVKKDTLIRVLPGKEWIEAARLPLLRKLWGLDTDVSVPPIQFEGRGSIPSINTFSVTNQIKPSGAVAKPGAKQPPRLETTIDINPLFRELYVEPEASSEAAAAASEEAALHAPESPVVSKDTISGVAALVPPVAENGAPEMIPTPKDTITGVGAVEPQVSDSGVPEPSALSKDTISGVAALVPPAAENGASEWIAEPKDAAAEAVVSEPCVAEDIAPGLAVTPKNTICGVAALTPRASDMIAPGPLADPNDMASEPCVAEDIAPEQPDAPKDAAAEAAASEPCVAEDIAPEPIVEPKKTICGVAAIEPRVSEDSSPESGAAKDASSDQAKTEQAESPVDQSDAEALADKEVSDALKAPSKRHVQLSESMSISSILAFGFESIAPSVSHTWELFDAGHQDDAAAKRELEAIEAKVQALDLDACEALEAAEAEDLQVISHSMLEVAEDSVENSGDGGSKKQPVSGSDAIASLIGSDVPKAPEAAVPESAAMAVPESAEVAVPEAPESPEAAAPESPEASEVAVPEAPESVASEASEAEPESPEVAAVSAPESPEVAAVSAPESHEAAAEAVLNHGADVDENAATHDQSILRSVKPQPAAPKSDAESVLQSLREMEIRAAEELKTNDLGAIDLLDVLAADDVRTHDCGVVSPRRDASPEAEDSSQDIQVLDHSDVEVEDSGLIQTIGKDDFIEVLPEDVTFVIASESVEANASVKRENIRNSEMREAIKAAESGDAASSCGRDVNQPIGRDVNLSRMHGRKRKNTSPMMSRTEEPVFQDLSFKGPEPLPADQPESVLNPLADMGADVSAPAVVPASDEPICALNRGCDENAMTRPILPEDRLPTRSRIRVRKSGHGRYGYPPEDDFSLADEVVESDMTHKFDDECEDMTLPQDSSFGAAKPSKKSSDDRLFHAESLLSVLERSSDDSDENDDNPSDIFKIRNRNDVKLRLADHEAELDAEAGEVSNSDKLRVRERSELRKLLFSKSKGTEEDTVKEEMDMAVKDYANMPQGELRRIFEKSDELHLYLANEIREKESEVERSQEMEAVADASEQAAKKKPVVADKDLEAMTSDMPVVSQAVVVEKPNHSAEPTHLTMKAIADDALSIQEQFIEEHLLDGEEKIASFDTFYLTTRRVWDIEVSRGKISNYGSYELEHISLLRMYNRRKKGLLSLAVAIMVCAVAGWAYVFVNKISVYNINWILLGIAVWALIMIPVFYLVGYRRVLQIGTGGMVVENRHAIPKELSEKAIDFLGRIDAARAERCRKLGK
ncbi:MAG: hypothetical protein IKY83_00785 [Proteobacteria bacterium]|nr:hypothetical protein [Pseudomonadota bacterium]